MHNYFTFLAPLLYASVTASQMPSGPLTFDYRLRSSRSEIKINEIYFVFHSLIHISDFVEDTSARK